MTVLAPEPARHQTSGITPDPAIPASVRLHLQVPIRRHDTAHGWFGGMANLPAAAPWPKRHGRDQIFVAQVNCAFLPAALWGGLGPRAGWLAVFVDPVTTEPTVLHLTERGQPRIGPDMASASWFRPDDPDTDSHRSIDNPSAWPLTIRAVAAGEADIAPAHPLFTQTANRPRTPRVDIASPQDRPFDWPTAIFAMRTVAQMLRWHHARWKRDTPQLDADAPLVAAIIADLRTEIDTLASLIDAAEKASEEALFVPAFWDLLAEGIGALRVPTARRLPEAESAATGQGLEIGAPTPALTCMTSSFWQPYRHFLSTHAAQVYADDTHIPGPVLDQMITEWSQISALEPAGMGNLPRARLSPPIGADMKVLFDIPSSDFLGWIWGIDLENLIIAISNEDLADNRFDRITHRLAC